MRKVIAAALLCIGTPAAAQSVEVAGGDWSDIPMIDAAGSRTLSESALQRIEQMMGRGGPCATAQDDGIAVRVPFLLQFGQSGKVERIVVHRVGCEQLERLLGTAVRDMAAAGEFRPTGENQANWYRGEIDYLIR